MSMGDYRYMVKLWSFNDITGSRIENKVADDLFYHGQQNWEQSCRRFVLVEGDWAEESRSSHEKIKQEQAQIPGVFQEPQNSRSFPGGSNFQEFPRSVRTLHIVPESRESQSLSDQTYRIFVYNVGLKLWRDLLRHFYTPHRSRMINTCQCKILQIYKRVCHHAVSRDMQPYLQCSLYSQDCGNSILSCLLSVVATMQ